MKVLFITCWYPTENQPGFGIFVQEHARAVVKAGADVKVVHVWPVEDRNNWYKPEYSHRVEDGIEVHSVLIRSRSNGLCYNMWPLLRRELNELLGRAVTDNWQPNLLHGHVLYPAGFLTLNLSRKLGLPYLLTEHWSKLNWVFRRPLYATIGNKVYRNATCIHPVSSFLKKQILNYVPGAAPMRIIPNAVDPRLFFPGERERAAEKTGKSRLLCVTRFEEGKEQIKRPALLVDAFSGLDEEIRNKLELVFIGPGGGQTELQKRVDSLRLNDSITFLGAQSKLSVSRNMKEADYLLHPTNMETFGIVVAEALCTGLPCIVSRVGGVGELLNEGSGFLVPENTVERWQGVLEKIAAGEFHFDRQSIADRNSRRFSYDEVGRAYAESYQDALKI